MVRRKDTGNGHLEDAFASLAQAQAALTQAQASLTQAHASLAHNQATFLEHSSTMDAQMTETNRINSERFARIESILMDLMEMMERLPEAVRDKIGFKGLHTGELSEPMETRRPFDPLAWQRQIRKALPSTFVLHRFVMPERSWSLDRTSAVRGAMGQLAMSRLWLSHAHLPSG